MGKIKMFYYDNAGKKVAKADFDKSKHCSVSINENGKWDLLMVCPTSKPMLEAASKNLGDWLKERKENMAEDWTKGASVDVIDDKPDEFIVKLPSCKIRDNEITQISNIWNDWCNALLNPSSASDDADNQSDQSQQDAQDQQDTQSQQSSQDQDQSQQQPPQQNTQDQPQQQQTQQSAPAQKKFWEMTPDELFDYNIKERERMRQKAAQRK